MQTPARFVLCALRDHFIAVTEDRQEAIVESLRSAKAAADQDVKAREDRVRRIEQELGRTAYVIATGGLSSVVARETTSIQALEPLLTLEGLALLYGRANGSPPPTWI